MTEWRCFHCDETFFTVETARRHFGTTPMQNPACTIDIAEYRRMEEAYRRSCEEDTDLHRELHAMTFMHQTNLRREEEKGYARGLQDGMELRKQRMNQESIGEIVASTDDSYGVQIVRWQGSYVPRIGDKLYGEADRLTITISRWSRYNVHGLYAVDLDLLVEPDVKGFFDFSWMSLGHVHAVLDDFGDLVPLDDLRPIRMHNMQNHDDPIVKSALPSEKQHRPPWIKEP